MNGLVQKEKAKELGLDTSTALAPGIDNHPSN